MHNNNVQKVCYEIALDAMDEMIIYFVNKKKKSPWYNKLHYWFKIKKFQNIRNKIRNSLDDIEKGNK